MKAIFFITILVLAGALVYDIRFGRIPNLITFPAIIAGITLNAYVGGLHGLLLSLSGMLAGFGLFIGLYLLGGMGAGDVKLMAAIGSLLGPYDAFNAAIYTAVAGGAYSVILILLYDFNRPTLKRYGHMIKTFFRTCRFVYIPSEKKIPSLRYGIAIAAGTMTVILRKCAW